MDLDEAKKTIEDGGIVVFPTETAYGIAADATNPDAVEKVYRAKDRPRSKGLTVIVNSLEQAEKYCELSEEEREAVREFMPGPLTFVAEKNDRVPEDLNENFVFRISSDEIARELAENTPITATSANLSGNDTSYSVEEIHDSLLERVDGVIDKGRLERRSTSTITGINNREVKIYREGPVSREDLEEVIEDGVGRDSHSGVRADDSDSDGPGDNRKED
ncbi:MAG: L-threonylcarbamoyladenylate synthase [Candidatus Nanohaloarchaea archaeon]